jgi:hypothetical protein
LADCYFDGRVLPVKEPAQLALVTDGTGLGIN